jgi:hypothetical protein
VFDTIAGLPLHPLVVHATEVTVPVTAMAVLLAALWPAFRRWAGVLPLALALASLVLVPLSTQSGEALEHRVGGDALIEKHSQLADGLLPWVIALVLVAAGLLAWTWKSRKADVPARGPRWVVFALAACALVATTGTTVQAVEIGHSGATAVWHEDMKAAPKADSDAG